MHAGQVAFVPSGLMRQPERRMKRCAVCQSCASALMLAPSTCNRCAG